MENDKEEFFKEDIKEDIREDIKEDTGENVKDNKKGHGSAALQQKSRRQNGSMDVTKVAYCALFTTLAMILSYVESLVPAPFPVPGIKLGLANLAIVVVLYYYGWKEAFIVSVLRIVLVSLLFGTMVTLSFSIVGGFLSLLVMAILKKTDWLPMLGVSMIGGVVHNAGQMVVAMIIVRNTKLGYYFAILMITGAITGILIGYVARMSLKILRRSTRL